MSTHNNSTSGTDTNKSKAWENMGNPDTKPTGDDETKKMGGTAKGWFR